MIAHSPIVVQPTRCTTIADAGRSGAHGPRVCDWAATPIRRGWVLARRSISDPTGIAYYVCHGPRGIFAGLFPRGFLLLGSVAS
jgi:hypothetical protein